MASRDRLPRHEGRKDLSRYSDSGSGFLVRLLWGEIRPPGFGALETWRMRLEEGRKLYGGEIVRVLGSRLLDWTGREHGALSFRLTQILTGHGVFDSYLARIDKEQTMDWN